MLSFLTENQLDNLYRFVRVDLSKELNLHIDIEEDKVVTGTFGNDVVEDAFIIRFFPEDSQVEWVEDKIITKLAKWLFENNIDVSRSIVIQRDVWVGKIRYGIVYTK